MAFVATKKLRKDYMKLEKDAPPGISASPSEENFLEWNAIISGPEETPFEGGCFKLRMIFPSNYPASPPSVWFYSKMFHPNVYPNGKICLDILEDPSKWNADYDAAAVLCGIQSMLGDPNPKSPANGIANDCFLNQPELYEIKVAQIVELSFIEDEECRNQNQRESEESLERDFQYALSFNLESDLSTE